jgi:two-component system sensor histidine kinase/response regulator
MDQGSPQINPITDTTGTDRLLVVDTPTEVQFLGSMLGKLGFEILPAHDGAQALKLLASQRPDLILLDLHLPHMDGFEICRRIQENSEWVDIPIIFASGENDKNLVARALESGGVDYIIKPYHKQELLSRVRTQLMLKTSRDHARRLAQDKDEVLGMISHHLQNHLVGLHMSAQLLTERMPENADPKLRLLSENIKSSSAQMRSFLKSFLANAAADHGLRIRLEPVSVADAVTRVCQQYEDAAQAKGIALRTEIHDAGLLVRTDVSALVQVLDNLVSNAIKFSPRGREVRLVAKGNATHAECRVEDQGAGFTEADKARMFHRYARLSARPTGDEPSTGLGLNIVKNLVQAMNGELNCESTPGIGTTFIVRLERYSVGAAS